MDKIQGLSIGNILKALSRSNVSEQIIEEYKKSWGEMEKCIDDRRVLEV